MKSIDAKHDAIPATSIYLPRLDFKLLKKKRKRTMNTVHKINMLP